MITEEQIREIIKPLFMLRSICICNNPIPGEFDMLYFTKCKTCGQDLSMMRVVDMGLENASR